MGAGTSQSLRLYMKTLSSIGVGRTTEWAESGYETIVEMFKNPGFSCPVEITILSDTEVFILYHDTNEVYHYKMRLPSDD